VTIALIRHGQTDWNRLGLLQGSTDIPLNDTGRAQAREAAAMLRDAGAHWDVVVSSPLARARETAAIIAEGIGVPLGDAVPLLVERHYGRFEGVSDDEVARDPLGKADPSVETLSSVVDRGVAAVDAIAAAHPGRSVVVVAHGTIIHYTLNAFAGADVGVIGNGTLAEIEQDGDGWRVTRVNDAPFAPRLEA